MHTTVPNDSVQYKEFISALCVLTLRLNMPEYLHDRPMHSGPGQAKPIPSLPFLLTGRNIFLVCANANRSVLHFCQTIFLQIADKFPIGLRSGELEGNSKRWMPDAARTAFNLLPVSTFRFFVYAMESPGKLSITSINSVSRVPWVYWPVSIRACPWDVLWAVSVS
jgi:hypothetical protein